MKKFLLLLAGFALLSTSCIDDDYDLSDVSTDNVTLGEKELRFPLVKIKVSTRDLQRNGVDVEEIFEEANDWLPSQLPAEYVDLERLVGDEAYLDDLLGRLMDQMLVDQEKLDVVSHRICAGYKAEFLESVGLPSMPDDQFLDMFRKEFAGNHLIQDQTRKLAQDYLFDLSIDPMSFRIDRIELSNDMVKMLSDNLDPEGTPNPKSTLNLYGDLLSVLPLSVVMHPSFVSTGVDFDIKVDATADVNPIEESEATRIYSNDLRRIVDGVEISIPIRLERYYPQHGFQSVDEQVVIDLKLIKRGGLHLDL